jgi:hypothetical protein
MGKESNYKISTAKGMCNGIFCALIINVWVVASFYVDVYDIVFYTMGLPLAISTYLLIKQSNIKYFFVAMILGIVIYFVIELILDSLGVVNMFFQHAVGDDLGMSAGTGLGLLIILMFNYIWIIIGTIAAFVVTVITQRKLNRAT